MNKQLIFSAMLGLCAFGSTAMYSVPAMAAVAQSPAIKVSGQVVDEQGEPLLGATIRVKNSSIEQPPIWMEISSWKCLVMLFC